MRQLLRLLVLIVGAYLFSRTSCVVAPGIRGKVLWVSGNQMPGPGSNPKGGEPVKREIFIFEETRLDDAKSVDGVFFDSLKTKLIAKVSSAANGTFYARVEPGRYSVFVKEPQGLFANQFDGNGCIRCVSVDSAKVTGITIEINYTAAY